MEAISIGVKNGENNRRPSGTGGRRVVALMLGLAMASAACASSIRAGDDPGALLSGDEPVPSQESVAAWSAAEDWLDCNGEGEALGRVIASAGINPLDKAPPKTFREAARRFEEGLAIAEDLDAVSRRGVKYDQEVFASDFLAVVGGSKDAVPIEARYFEKFGEYWAPGSAMTCDGRLQIMQTSRIAIVRASRGERTPFMR